EARVVELVDQRRDDRAVLGMAAVQEGVAQGFAQRQVLDALCRPVHGDLGARNAPDLLGVGLEEDLVQPVPKAVRHPLLEAGLFGRRPETGFGVTQADQQGFERSEAGERIQRLQRVIEEMAAIMDARQPRSAEKVLAEDLVPQAVDQRYFRKEAMAADVKAVAAILHGAR